MIAVFKPPEGSEIIVESSNQDNLYPEGTVHIAIGKLNASDVEPECFILTILPDGTMQSVANHEYHITFVDGQIL